MHYEVYIDAVFLTNLIMDYVILRLLTRILKYESSHLRCAIGAITGAIGSCMILIVPINRFEPAVMLLHCIVAVIMVKIGCKVRTKSMLLRAIVMLYFIGFLCGGFWDVLSADGGVTLKTFFMFAAMTYGMITCAAWCKDYWKMRTENLFQVHISYNGKVLCVKGYYDTGNLLTDLGSSKPVSIISWEALKKLIPEIMIEQLKSYHISAEEPNRGEWRSLKPHFLSFQSVGNPSGMALAITLDDMCIHGEHQEIWIHQPVMAMPQEEFQLIKDCQIILNARLMEQ